MTFLVDSTTVHFNNNFTINLIVDSFLKVFYSNSSKGNVFCHLGNSPKPDHDMGKFLPTPITLLEVIL